jgi:hypothetical protein
VTISVASPAAAEPMLPQCHCIGPAWHPVRRPESRSHREEGLHDHAQGRLAAMRPAEVRRDEDKAIRGWMTDLF